MAATAWIFLIQAQEKNVSAERFIARLQKNCTTKSSQGGRIHLLRTLRYRTPCGPTSSSGETAEEDAEKRPDGRTEEGRLRRTSMPVSNEYLQNSDFTACQDWGSPPCPCFPFR